MKLSKKKASSLDIFTVAWIRQRRHNTATWSAAVSFFHRRKMWHCLK